MDQCVDCTYHLEFNGNSADIVYLLSYSTKVYDIKIVIKLKYVLIVNL